MQIPLNVLLYSFSTNSNFEVKNANLGATLQELLNITNGFLSHPMVVFDRNFSVLGHVQAPDEEDPFMDDLVRTGYATPLALSKLREDGLISTSEDAANPLINQYYLPDNNSYYSMMYRFTSNRNIVGYVLVMRCNTHPKTNYLYLMNMICQTLKKYFQQDRFSNRASSEVYEAILADILEHPDLPQKQITDQIQSLTDLPLEGNFMLARISYAGTKDMPYSFVSQNLRNAIPSMKPFVCHNVLYVLKINTAPENCCQFLSESEEPFFKQIFRNHSFTCGLSQTSTKTFMHRNTVLNKVKKATSIMNNTFNDYHDQTAFIFSYFNDEHPRH